jgi:hypothetical protein
MFAFNVLLTSLENEINKNKKNKDLVELLQKMHPDLLKTVFANNIDAENVLTVTEIDNILHSEESYKEIYKFYHEAYTQKIWDYTYYQQQLAHISFLVLGGIFVAALPFILINFLAAMLSMLAIVSICLVSFILYSIIATPIIQYYQSNAQILDSYIQIGAKTSPDSGNVQVAIPFSVDEFEKSKEFIDVVDVVDKIGEDTTNKSVNFPLETPPSSSSELKQTLSMLYKKQNDNPSPTKILPRNDDITFQGDALLYNNKLFLFNQNNENNDDDDFYTVLASIL